jgi:hypothetical protein
MIFGVKFTDYCKKHTEHTNKVSGQNLEIVPQRKQITSPLQTPTG